MIDPQPASVLVVEFEPLQRDLILLALKRSGYTPVLCEDAAGVRQMLLAHQPGVMLVDLYLPGVNALDLMRGLLQEGFFKQRAVIVLSALGFKEVVRQAIEAGADDFLVKPLQPEILIARIERAVSKKGLNAG
jgi:DNA-binding response OmpR family regulator